MKIKNLHVWFLLILILVLMEKPYLDIPFSANEGMFTHVAQEMRYGSELYRDVWDHKPPLLFLHFVLLEDLFGNGELSIRLYVILFHFLDAVLLFFLANRLFSNRRVGFFAAWAYVFLLFPPYFQAWSLQAELLIQPFLIAAFLLFSLSESAFSYALSGLMWTIGFFTKPIALFFLPLFFLLKKSQGLKPGIFFVLGADLASLIIVLPFLLDGRFPLIRDAIWNSNLGYMSNGWKYFLESPQYQHHVWFWHETILAAFGLPLLAFCLSLFKGRQNAMVSRLFLGGWLMASLCSCLMSGYFHPYYYFMVTPPLSLGVGIFLEKLWSERKSLFFAFGTLSMILLLRPWFDVVMFGPIGITNAEYSASRSMESKEVGLYLKNVSKPGQKLMAWASEAQIYTYSGLKMGVLKSPLSDPMGKPTGNSDELKSEFVSNRPDYVVISHFDQLPAPPVWLLQDIQTQYMKLHSWPHYDLFALENQP